ncbi:MAG: UDP-N-acetylmuramate--L-alanine ligase [Desulfovibrio sp.]|nr:UDP-N-acetylmuramate--L-alanine ligase [Desulfovibrio sp.]
MNDKLRKIHMIGIGGAGMSGIAEILLNQGYQVSGSDLADSGVIGFLRGLGAKIAIGHAAGNIADAQVVVKSTAVTDDNPEVVEARARKIAVIPRAEMLAELMRLRYGIAVAGTHGKTTTTSLVAAIFDAAGLDPTVVIGGRLNAYGANAHLGQGRYLIAEADESDGSFLCLFSIINIVTNIDADHLDHYGSLASIEEAFLQFMNNAPFYGLNVVCGENAGVRKLLPAVKRPVMTYGFDPASDLAAVIIEEGAVNIFDVFLHGQLLGRISLPQPGRHNVLNALAAIGVALACDVPFAKCQAGLAAFGGVGRRFELRGEKGGITVVDDYGHHPAEIAATLAAARKVFPGRRLVAAFQPHRFSRTQALFGDFCRVFADVDELLLTEIYAASEKPSPGVSGQSLAQGIRQVTDTPLQYCQSLDDLLQALYRTLKPGDVLLTLGAGSITKIAGAWLEGRSNA